MDGVESPFETSDISDHESMLNGNSSDTDVEEDGTPRRRRRLRRRAGSLPVPQLGQVGGAGPPSRDSSPVDMQLQLADDESEEEESQPVQPDHNEPDQNELDPDDPDQPDQDSTAKADQDQAEPTTLKKNLSPHVCAGTLNCA